MVRLGFAECSYSMLDIVLQSLATPCSPHFRPRPYSALTINVSICADTSELPGCLSVNCINKALRLEKMSVSH